LFDSTRPRFECRAWRLTKEPLCPFFFPSCMAAAPPMNSKHAPFFRCWPGVLPPDFFLFLFLNLTLSAPTLYLPVLLFPALAVTNSVFLSSWALWCFCLKANRSGSAFFLFFLLFPRSRTSAALGVKPLYPLHPEILLILIPFSFDPSADLDCPSVVLRIPPPTPLTLGV